MEKGEIARNEQFLLFPQCFLPVWQTFCHFHQSWNCRLQTLSVWKSLKFVVWEGVNVSLMYRVRSTKWQLITGISSLINTSFVTLTHSQTMTPFDAPGKQAFWKHCGKRRNCLSNFSFSHNVLDNLLLFSSNLKLSSANSFSVEESKICCLVMG